MEYQADNSTSLFFCISTGKEAAGCVLMYFRLYKLSHQCKDQVYRRLIILFPQLEGFIIGQFIRLSERLNFRSKDCFQFIPC